MHLWRVIVVVRLELELHAVHVLVLEHLDEGESGVAALDGAFCGGVHAVIFQVCVEGVSPNLVSWAPDIAVWTLDGQFADE